MEHKKGFRHNVLPHYLSVLTSVVSLADIAICACGQELSETEEARWRDEVNLAYMEIQEAVNDGRKIQDDVDSETEDTPLKKFQDEVESVRRNLQDVEMDLILQELKKEKLRDQLQNCQAKLLHSTETLNRTNALKAEKETFRNMGFGLILIPFIGIPMVLSSSREVKRCEDLIQKESKAKQELEKEWDQEELNLKACYEKIKELKQKRVECESLREKEKKLLTLEGEVAVLCDTQREVGDHLNYLTELKGPLELLHRQCTEDTFYGIKGVKGFLQNIFTCIQQQGFDTEWLSDCRLHTKLLELEEKIPKFNSIYNI
ncbi:uncharacterized protein LOC121271647 [Carcharodon carcharias]|uniref:uncharacterized protein LOC121271647 n=1 Tax=Carcharodon carcharias TaxID=13397 RepID=UPI001B7E2131|nr:uncharacterized protein LOC121271647 [Carcharodon carcharias]